MKPAAATSIESCLTDRGLAYMARVRALPRSSLLPAALDMRAVKLATSLSKLLARAGLSDTANGVKDINGYEGVAATIGERRRLEPVISIDGGVNRLTAIFAAFLLAVESLTAFRKSFRACSDATFFLFIPS